ncbi:hypothetical protein G3N55_00725 [Dissulfurirhabdus thermomarina]|uniref:Uncharacterized protein n=1 Tax=Dissulfurirhabdus thermomarina TaxID=1765737 RepID=A0A6N9TJF3_DISTH|nr:hypothetical protein [Dissulfurirhabdus thermomarina]NDY41375.1 hypothetical protein [Dissulfurirhabdus thermomarina]NMX23609.1 hypothetical protein [Dissulfurirhabdus thermomarina]
MASKKIYILLPNRMYAGDGVRSALGQAVENHYAYPVFMHGEYPRFSEYVTENIDWIKDMEGDVLNVGGEPPEGVELTSLTLEELGERLREADVIIPYGLKKQTKAPPPACAD